jgi:hypothetical protein
MPTITITISKEVDQRFRNSVKEKIGIKKGSLNKGVQQALDLFAKLPHQEICKLIGEPVEYEIPLAHQREPKTLDQNPHPFEPSIAKVQEPIVVVVPEKIESYPQANEPIEDAESDLDKLSIDKKQIDFEDVKFYLTKPEPKLDDLPLVKPLVEPIVLSDHIKKLNKLSTYTPTIPDETLVDPNVLAENLEREMQEKLLSNEGVVTDLTDEMESFTESVIENESHRDWLVKFKALEYDEQQKQLEALLVDRRPDAIDRYQKGLAYLTEKIANQQTV